MTLPADFPLMSHQLSAKDSGCREDWKNFCISQDAEKLEKFG
jgi:hypothetical protein